MKVLGVIPALQSLNGIPRMNLRELGNEPLFAHSLATSKEIDAIEETILVTDSREIEQIAESFDTTTLTAYDTLEELSLVGSLEYVSQKYYEDHDYILCLGPKTPLISSETIAEGLRLCENQGTDNVIYVGETTSSCWSKSEGPPSDHIIRSASVDTGGHYVETSVFAVEPNSLLNQDSLRYHPTVMEVGSREATTIETIGDWIQAQNFVSQKTIVYRLKGNQDTGSGHVYRGLTIADGIFKHNVKFAVGADQYLAIEKIEETGYEYITFDGDTEFLSNIREIRPDIVVNDFLNTEPEYITALRQITPRVVNFEDLGNGSEYADIVVNALYEYTNPPKNHYFGHKFFCLRNEFRYADSKEEIPSVDRIMISFGGVDVNNLTARTLGLMSDIDRELHLDVVLGLGYTKRETLDPILESLPQSITVEVNQNIKSMAKRMAKSDLLVTSNGRTVYEAASLNLPVISIAQNHREQRHPFSHVSKGVISLGLADHVSQKHILAAIEDYINNHERREMMRDVLSQHDIEGGIERVVELILGENDDT